MDTSNEEEIVPLIPNDSIPTAARDTRRPYQKQLALYFVLASILFESIAFSSLNLTLPHSLHFNETLNWTYEHSSIAEYIFAVVSDWNWRTEEMSFILSLIIGTIVISMIIFAIISDAKLNRATTIIIGLPLYLVGFILNALFAKGTSFICSANNNNYSNATSIGDERCAYLVLPAIIVTAIGVGAVRANMIAFGGDQIQESELISRYIDKFIVVINIGSIIMTLIVTIVPDGHDYYFQLYVVGACMLFVSSLLFIIGWRYYRHMKPYDSVVTNCIPVVINAFQTWRRYKGNRRCIDSPNNEVEESIGTSERTTTFLHYAKLINHGRFLDRIVDDVKSFRNALIIPILLFPYWIILTQFFSTFQAQASHMAHANDTKNTLNMLLLTEPITIIIGIFILNMFVYKYLHARNQSLSIATKFVLSMSFAFISMCIAGGVEISRQDHCPKNQTLSNLPIYAQFPQEIVVGVAQLFALLAWFEFTYFVAPRTVASYLDYTIDIVLSKDDISFGFTCPTSREYVRRYFIFFFILACVQLIFIIIFIVCQKKISDDQVKSTTNGKKSVFSAFIY